ncbi:20744_t:CDS:2, partial [Cetraspora pellucida]
KNNMCKRSKFIKNMASNEKIKDYKPSIIANVIKKEASKVYENSDVEYLKTKKVANIKQKLVGSMNLHLVENHGWCLFILYICDGYGCWNAGAHFFVNRETSEAVAAALRIIRNFASYWNPYPTLNKMVHAMHKRTQVGCEDVVYNAVNTCSIQANAKYITRNYLKNSRQWSLWARQHLLLLLQITSTNPLESFH